MNKKNAFSLVIATPIHVKYRPQNLDKDDWSPFYILWTTQAFAIRISKLKPISAQDSSIAALKLMRLLGLFIPLSIIFSFWCGKKSEMFYEKRFILNLFVNFLWLVLCWYCEPAKIIWKEMVEWKKKIHSRKDRKFENVFLNEKFCQSWRVLETKCFYVQVKTQIFE